MTERMAHALAATAPEPRLTRDELVRPFAASEKPFIAHRVGVELEKFACHWPSGAPVDYAGILRLFDGLIRQGFREERETKDGPVIALRRGACAVTLEPGGQFELSGSPHLELHAVAREIEAHHRELSSIAEPLGIVFCSSGFHPLATRQSLPWVPKRRYRIMREYLQRLGSGALDMMQRTATVQVNLDYGSEADALGKLRLALKLSPLVHSMTANAPLSEGRLEPSNSLRGDVWTRMDPSRSGLIERLWHAPNLKYDDYIEWALDAGMFLIKRGGEILPNTGQTFRDFLRHGYQGHFATMSDWQLHINTLFPEVRLKNTLEMRSADAQPASTVMSIPALWLGLTADERAIDEAQALADTYDFEDMTEARAALIHQGYAASLAGHPLAYYAERILRIAEDGLERRRIRNDAGNTEKPYLAPLVELFEQRKTPSTLLRERLKALPKLDAHAILDATRLF